MLVRARDNETDALSKSEAQALATRAARAARLLKLLANERRLLILCRLIEQGEMNVTQLSDAVGLAQSALSQHLAKMREDGLVAFRRESQTIWYRIADPTAQRLLQTLHDVFVEGAESGDTA
jgi:ArsR family transcriptional regulator, virulence genes transcriptional regulator